jgi:hypothetical protein
MKGKVGGGRGRSKRSLRKRPSLLRSRNQIKCNGKRKDPPWTVKYAGRVVLRSIVYSSMRGSDADTTKRHPSGKCRDSEVFFLSNHLCHEEESQQSFQHWASMMSKEECSPLGVGFGLGVREVWMVGTPGRLPSQELQRVKKVRDRFSISWWSSTRIGEGSRHRLLY